MKCLKMMSAAVSRPGHIYAGGEQKLAQCDVTNLADAGVDTETIMKIVGHSSVEMFLRYRKIRTEKLDAAMHRLNTLITRRPVPIS